MPQSKVRDIGLSYMSRAVWANLISEHRATGQVHSGISRRTVDATAGAQRTKWWSLGRRGMRG